MANGEAHHLTRMIHVVVTSGWAVPASADHSVGKEERLFADCTAVAIVPALNLQRRADAAVRLAVAEVAAVGVVVADVAKLLTAITLVTATSIQEAITDQPLDVQPAIQETQSSPAPVSLDNQMLHTTRDLTAACIAKTRT